MKSDLASTKKEYMGQLEVHLITLTAFLVKLKECIVIVHKN